MSISGKFLPDRSLSYEICTVIFLVFKVYMLHACLSLSCREPLFVSDYQLENCNLSDIEFKQQFCDNTHMYYTLRLTINYRTYQYSDTYLSLPEYAIFMKLISLDRTVNACLNSNTQALSEHSGFIIANYEEANSRCGTLKRHQV